MLPAPAAVFAAGAAFGAVPGSLMGMVVLGCFYRYYRKRWLAEAELRPCREELSSSKLVKELLLLALPVSCANVLVPGYLIESGFTVEQATTLFGYLAGMAQPLLLLATIPTMSLATSLVPAIAEAYTLKQTDIITAKATTAMKLCCLITVPAAVGMAVLAEPISLLLYGTAKAGTAIMHSAPSLWFLGMHQVTTGMLQGMGHSNLPMLHMLAGIIAKLFAVCQLTNATLNIAGAAWATNINFGLTALLNILALRYYKISFRWYNILKIIVAAGLMGLVAWWAHGLLLVKLGMVLATIAAMLLAALFYAALLCALQVLTKQELQQLPLVKKIVQKRKKA